MAFQKAVKRALKAKVAFMGPSGSGKTLSALRVARGLVGPTGKIAMLDTERKRANLYANACEFDTDPDFGPPYTPEKFIAGIKAAAEAGYDCLIIDSISHEWAGRGGLLEYVDDIAAKDRGENRFTAWRHGTPKQQDFIDAILAARIHIIATMRSKQEYVIEEVTGKDGRKKQVPRRLGMAPVQGKDIEYEFDFLLDLDQETHTAVVAKTRISELDGKRIEKPGEELGQMLAGWLDGAEPEPEPEPKAAPTPNPTPAPAPAPAPATNGNGGSSSVGLATEPQRARLRELAGRAELSEAQRRAAMDAANNAKLKSGAAGSFIGKCKAALEKVAADIAAAGAVGRQPGDEPDEVGAPPDEALPF